MPEDHPEAAEAGDARRQRPLRLDAQRNRARLLAAADAVFAERGPAASTEAVARRAGVAIGTVFRHFPTKEALVEAVLAARAQELLADTESLAAAADAGAAFFEFLDRLAQLSATKHAVADAFAGAIDLREVMGAHASVVAELLDRMEVLLTRAQQAGAVRGDIGLPELRALLVATARVAEYTGTDRDLRARTLAVVADGLRPRTN